MKTWLMLLASAVAMEVVATLSLRAMNGFDRPWFLVAVVVGYAGAFLILARLLAAGMAVGVAYGVWAASGVALTAALGALIFDDALTWVVGAGIVLVIGGVLLVEIGSQKAAPVHAAQPAAHS